MQDVFTLKCWLCLRTIAFIYFLPRAAWPIYESFPQEIAKLSKTNEEGSTKAPCPLPMSPTNSSFIFTVKKYNSLRAILVLN